MQTSHWQTMLAVVCVAGAVIFLLLRMVRMWSNASGVSCGSGECGGCSSKVTSDQSQNRRTLVPLETFDTLGGVTQTSRSEMSGCRRHEKHLVSRPDGKM